MTITTRNGTHSMADKPIVDEDTLDALMTKVEAEGLELMGPDGVLTQLTSQIINRALEAEMTDHLGYEKDDRAGWGSGNNRNGHTTKNVKTTAGDVPGPSPETGKALSTR